MKHTVSVTLIMVMIFFLSQVIGLYALNANISGVVQTPGGEVIVEHADTAIGERPPIEGIETFAYILVAVLIGTGLILLMVRFKKTNVWKGMFFFAVWMTCSITLGVFIDPILAFVACAVLAFFKVFRPNIYVHNFTELFIYAGIALIFVPLLDIVWVSLLLLAISAYDMFAVWKSKHMISLAKFQTSTRAFAGVMLSYKVKVQASAAKAMVKSKGAKGKTKPSRVSAQKVEKEENRNAILGGGDIAFPLIFAGVVMDAMIQASVSKTAAFLYSLVIPVTVAIALFALLAFAKKDRFYPAMPFLSAGCFAGYAIIWLVTSVGLIP
jgi:presenilin-like A22 family membrane protease